MDRWVLGTENSSLGGKTTDMRPAAAGVLKMLSSAQTPRCSIPPKQTEGPGNAKGQMQLIRPKQTEAKLKG